MPGCVQRHEFSTRDRKHCAIREFEIWETIDAVRLLPEKEICRVEVQVRIEPIRECDRGVHVIFVAVSEQDAERVSVSDRARDGLRIVRGVNDEGGTVVANHENVVLNRNTLGRVPGATSPEYPSGDDPVDLENVTHL